MAIPTAQELNEKIVFQTKSGARNAVKRTAETLTTVCTVFARITANGGRVEETTQGNEAIIQSYEIWIRHDSRVTGFQQILWGTKRLLMLGPPVKVTDGNNRPWMLIQAEETTES